MKKIDVFISYATIDKRPREICKILEDNGISCWIAPRNIKQGIPYAREIIAGISKCTYFLVFITENSIKSEDVLNEIDNAKRRDKIIVPIFLQDIPLTKDFAYYLNRNQWINLYDISEDDIDKTLSRFNDIINFEKGSNYEILSTERLKELTAQNNNSASFALAERYYNGSFDTEENKFLSAKYYRISAKNGNIESMFRLGKMYYDGIGVLQDFFNASNWFEQAALLGHPRAQYELAHFYSSGLGGITKDLEKAKLYYQAAADQGIRDAQNDIAVIYDNERQFDLAIRYYKLAAEAGHAMSQFALYYIFTYNRDYKNLDLALQYLKLAAEQDYVDAQYELGISYLKGFHGNMNITEGISLLTIAANKNCKKALLEISYCYNMGIGVEKNFEKADFYADKASQIIDA